MPSEHCLPPDVPLVDQPPPPQQVKLCSSCLCPLSPESINLLHPEAAIVCTQCREHIYAIRDFVDQSDPIHDAPIQVPDFTTTQHIDQIQQLSPSSSPPPPSPASPHAPAPATSPTTSSISIIAHQHSPYTIPASSSNTPPSSLPASISLVDPHADITRLRVRSHSQDCLYPGAKFLGTQKNGRSSYEVSVTIVDVDFASSFLCGYLRIRGLTDDWPELTTYFDAQIIGSRYGFLTDDWGATEQEDMTHWARFPSFHKVRHEVCGPHLTIRDRDRDCVFMRWKERFLVPDHRVRDINGASFAGFYYVCVEFNPKDDASSAQQAPADAAAPLSHSDAPAAKPDGSTTTRIHRVPSSAAADPHSQWNVAPCDDDEFGLERAAGGTATMSGFYFHQNSEPYQQLSLRHIPASSTGAFEFR